MGLLMSASLYATARPLPIPDPGSFTSLSKGIHKTDVDFRHNLGKSTHILSRKLKVATRGIHECTLDLEVVLFDKGGNVLHAIDAAGNCNAASNRSKQVSRISDLSTSRHDIDLSMGRFH